VTDGVDRVNTVHLLNQEELQIALIYLLGALPYEPKWAAVITLDGHLVAQVQVKREAARLEALFSVTEGLNNLLTHGMGNGDFQYNLMMAENGAILTMLLGRDYLIYVNVGRVKSIDAMFKAVQEGLTPLKDVLGLHA
jgi:hypothetical protein